MFDDEEVPARTAQKLEKPVLDTWSVADLRLYIAELQAEIARAEGVISQKEGARGHADSFFRKP